MNGFLVFVPDLELLFLKMNWNDSKRVDSNPETKSNEMNQNKSFDMSDPKKLNNV